MDHSSLPPSQAVLEQFCVSGDLNKLSGGQGMTWRCGSLVFKPLDMPIEAMEWLDGVVRTLPDVEAGKFRISFPQKSKSGKLLIENWTAFPVLEGSHLERRWLDIMEIGYGFSDLLETLECPPFIKDRQDPWAIADRAAWEEQDVVGLLSVPHVARLFAAMHPVHDRSQLIHGDLAGNILFHPTLPPAVIDLTFYWRPKAFAAAIVVVDALCFEMANQSIFDAAEQRYVGRDDFAQYVLRALAFRILTDFLRNDKQLGGDQDPYITAVNMVCLRAEHGGRI